MSGNSSSNTLFRLDERASGFIRATWGNFVGVMKDARPPGQHGSLVDEHEEAVSARG